MNIHWLIKIWNFQGGWSKVLTACVLLGSMLQTSVPVAVAQTRTGRQFNFNNQASYTYGYQDTDKNNQPVTKIVEGTSIMVPADNSLIDPIGQILGCGGALLPDYTGFSVSLHEPSGPTGTDPGQLVSLTTSEIPDIPNNGVPAGIPPNSKNINPYPVGNDPIQYKGVYNFLLDATKSQVNIGKTYILVINPPINSIYQQQMVKLEILSNANNIVSYRATSLDGKPISVNNSTTITSTQIVNNAATDLLGFKFDLRMCQSNQIRITKTGDRATAEPGDTAIYRISAKNTSQDIALNNLVVTDILPLGFRFLPNSVRAELDGQIVDIKATQNGSTIKFSANTTIETNKSINIAYAVQLTNDAQRGTGLNSATVISARKDDPNITVKDGPATHYLKVRGGITSDSGIIIGRVFVDKNFDGEQQPGEPGIPNAVIYLENGNRIITDNNGLFSLVNVLPGPHTGVLDLSSLPGYTLAPNRKFKERNSQSRLVRIAPGSMVKMNFAVTPTFQEEGETP